MRRSATCLVASCCVALASVLLPSVGSPEDGEELIVLTWVEYLAPALVAEFEQETGATIRFSYFGSDEHRDEILATNIGRDYDVVLVNGASVPTYVARGWLAALSPKSLPNLKHIDRRWRSAYAGTEEFAVPYFWGTLGIAYRKDLIPQGLSSWKEFYQPPESLRGRISTLKSRRDIVGMALKALGHSANSSDRDEIRAAGRLLAAQKPFVRLYGYIDVDEKSPLVTGEVWASMVYSGDAGQLRPHGMQIEYVVPEEGTNIWCDYFAVLQSSSRKELAAKFIDFMSRPDVASRNSIALKYASPNAAARARLPEADLADTIMNPTEEVVSRSEMYQRLPPRAQKLVNSIYATIVN
jgi:spermidine/putrescine transport system substrate-binding protein